MSLDRDIAQRRTFDCKCPWTKGVKQRGQNILFQCLCEVQEQEETRPLKREKNLPASHGQDFFTRKDTVSRKM